MRFRPPNAFTSALLAAGIGFLILAAGLEPGARIVPLSVALPLAALLLVQWGREVRAVAANRSATPPGIARATGAGPANPAGASSRTERIALGWLLGFGALILMGGLLAAAALFIPLYLRREGREGWLVALASGAVAGLALWLVITRALVATVPTGLIGALARSLFAG